MINKRVSQYGEAPKMSEKCAYSLIMREAYRRQRMRRIWRAGAERAKRPVISSVASFDLAFVRAGNGAGAAKRELGGGHKKMRWYRLATRREAPSPRLWAIMSAKSETQSMLMAAMSKLQRQPS
jgi:hypothetical protein